MIIISFYCNINLMKAISFLLVGLLLYSSLSLQTQSPAWIINPNMDAGEIVCVNGLNASTFILTPTTIATSQHYNKTNFATAPNVILSMIGYSHSAPSLPADAFGFRILITGVNLLNFTYNLTTYSCQVYDLHYLYLAVQYDTSTFYMGTVIQTFNSSTNLANPNALQRWQTFTYNNPTGWVNPNFSLTNTQVIVFPTGFQIAAQSGWSYFGINATLIDSSTYSVNISTSGSNILYFIDFSVIMFNSADISANYSVYVDIMTTSMVGNSTTYYPPVISPSQYLFRNCLTGAVDITFKVTGVAAVWYFYNYSSTNNNYLVWKAFNNRVRSCPANLSYYNPTNSLCQDICEPYYYVNTTYNVCIPCAVSCYNCSQPNSPSSCTTCSGSDHRTLVGTSCACNDGHYDNGVSVCALCNYRCLTCSGLATSCISCNSALFRTINATTNECLCDSGYYENNTCMTCQTTSTGCTSCSYNTSTTIFKCFTCDASLFRTLDSNSSKCLCLIGYYQDATSVCQPCSVGCLFCNFNGTHSICGSCDVSLIRTMGTGNLTCDCQVGYYQNANGTCSLCPIGCLSCIFNGTTPICASCNLTLYRTIDSANTSCPCLSAYFADSNHTCQTCPLGCLTCALASSSVICSSCDSTLIRTLSAANTSCDCINGYYQNSSQLCTACPYGCLTCYPSSSSGLCTSCDSSALRTMGSGNLTCDCQQGTYQSSNSSCLSCPGNCTTCSLNATSIICSACLAGYFPNGSGLCIACSLGCSSCQFDVVNFTQVCLNCSSNLNFILQNSSCSCTNGTTLVGSSCVSNTNATSTTNTTNATTSSCGNGVLQSWEGCDDGNTINQDGCSSTCQVEQYHSCINNNTLYNVSLCYYSNKIQFDPQLIYKIPAQNSVELRLRVKAPLCNPAYLKDYLEQTSYLALYDRSRLLLAKESSRQLQGSVSWISIPAKTISYDPSTGLLTIVFDYDSTIDLSQKYIQFIPSSSTSSPVKYFYASPTAQLTLSQPYNNLPTVYYSSEELSTVKAMKYLFLVLIMMYWIFLMVTLIRKKGVIGTECMLVLQVTYLSLIDQERLVESWSGLQLTGRYTIGFNPKLVDTAYEPDLYALELDSNLINVLSITLGLILMLCLLLVVCKLYELIEDKRIKKLMQMDVSQHHQSVKSDKPSVKTVDKAIVYVIDALLSLLFLAIGVFMVTIIFTNSLNLIGNIIETTCILIVLIVFWALYYRHRQTYSFKNISYNRIVINPTKTSFEPILKSIITNYYFILYLLWMAAGLMMSLVRSIGIVAYALIIVGGICALVFHIKFKIYFQILDSRRCIVNSSTLILLMTISLFSSLLANQLGVGRSIIIAVFCILFTLLAFNCIIFMILQKKRIKVEKQQQMHDEEMKQMDNELAMANISFIGKGYNSINKSRDYTKDKDFLNSLEFTSTRRKVLLDDQNKIVELIEDKIKELKDFKKNIQGQIDSSNSHQVELPQNSQNNATIANVLGELGIEFEENQLDDI